MDPIAVGGTPKRCKKDPKEPVANAQLPKNILPPTRRFKMHHDKEKNRKISTREQGELHLLLIRTRYQTNADSPEFDVTQSGTY